MKFVSKLVNQVSKQFITRRLLNDHTMLKYLSHAGLFLKHRKYNTIFSSAVWRSLGHNHEPEGDSWLSYVHPDDRSFMEESWDYLDRGGSDYVQVEFRIRDVHGTYHWVLSQNWVLTRNSRNQVQAYLGHDISFEGIRQFQRDFSLAAKQADELALDDQKITTIKDQFSSATGYDEIWSLILQHAWDLVGSPQVWIFRFDSENVGWQWVQVTHQPLSGLLEPISFSPCPKAIHLDVTKYVDRLSSEDSPMVRYEQMKDLPKALSTMFTSDPFQSVLTGSFSRNPAINGGGMSGQLQTKGLIIFSPTSGMSYTHTDKNRLFQFLQLIEKSLSQISIGSQFRAYGYSPTFQVDHFCSRLMAFQGFIDDSSEQCSVLYCDLDLIEGWERSPLAKTIEQVLDETAKLLLHWVQQKSGLLGNVTANQFLCWLPGLHTGMDPRLLIDLQYMLEHRSRSLGFPLFVRLTSHRLEKKKDLASQISEAISG
jgi:hypothetical protein